MKLLFLNTNIGYGGASKMIVWVANQCAEKGHDVTFLTYRDKTIYQPISSKINLVQEDWERINGRSNSFKTILYLHKYIKKEKFNVAISFLSPSQLRLAIACVGTKTKVLFSHRGDPYTRSLGFKSKIIGAVSHQAFVSADAFVFQTDQAMNYFGSKTRNKAIVIPNPINPLKRTKSREGYISKRIVNVGRLDIFQKRQDLLIEAFKKICKDYPDYILDFYGDGPDDEKLRILTKDCLQIRFMGKTSNVVDAIQNATMFVLSSDFEGIPNALLEAMSLGLPCISTDCSPGGAALLIQNGNNGILTKRGDADDLAKAMKFMLDNPEQAESMGVEALKVIETFSEDRIKQQWLNIIERL